MEQIILTSKEELKSIIIDTVTSCLIQNSTDIGFISDTQVYAKYGITFHKLFELQRDGTLNKYRIGGKMLFKPSEIETYLQKSKLPNG